MLDSINSLLSQNFEEAEAARKKAAEYMAMMEQKAAKEREEVEGRIERKWGQYEEKIFNALKEWIQENKIEEGEIEISPVSKFDFLYGYDERHALSFAKRMLKKGTSLVYNVKGIKGEYRYMNVYIYFSYTKRDKWQRLDSLVGREEARYRYEPPED